MHDVPTISDGQKTFSRVLDDIVERLINREGRLVQQAKDSLPIVSTAGQSEFHQPKPQESNKSKLEVKEALSAKHNEFTGPDMIQTAIAFLPQTVRNIDDRLSQIIPLQLYSFLLERLFSSKPVELRAFLTTADPGPGTWDVRHCLYLYKKAWPGLSAILPQDRIAATSEAIIWLEGFLAWYSDPLREKVCPGRRTSSQTNQDVMHIDDDGVGSGGDETIRRGWEQAKEAILLIFRPCLDEPACVELDEVLQWMTGN